MSTQAQATLPGKDIVAARILYMAIEMEEMTWKFLLTSGEVKRNGQLRVCEQSGGEGQCSPCRTTWERPVRMREIQRRLVDRGVWVRPFGRLVYLMPPYIISDHQLDWLCGAVHEVLAEGLD